MARDTLAIADLADGSYTIKKIGNKEYLFKVHYEKGKQKWKSLGAVKDLDPKDSNLAKARSVMLAREAREIFERWLHGEIDKTKAKSELVKLLDEL